MSSINKIIGLMVMIIGTIGMLITFIMMFAMISSFSAIKTNVNLQFEKLTEAKQQTTVSIGEIASIFNTLSQTLNKTYSVIENSAEGMESMSECLVSLTTSPLLDQTTNYSLSAAAQDLKTASEGLRSMLLYMNTTNKGMTDANNSLIEMKTQIGDLKLTPLKNEIDTLITRITFGLILFSASLLLVFFMFSLIGYVIFSST